MPAQSFSAAMVGLFVLLMVGAVAPAQGATISTLDGQTLNGPALVFDSHAGTVTLGAQTLSLSDCDWLEPGAGAGVPLPTGKAINLWLCDGSWMPVTSLDAATTGDNALAVDGPLGPLTLPLARVRGWSLGEELDVPSDGAASDLIQLDSGLYPMTVEGLEGGKLKVQNPLEKDKPQLLPLGDVHALRMGLPVPPVKGLILVAILSDQRPGLRLVVGASGPSEQALRLAAVPELPVGAALIGARLRTEGGRRVYLSTLTPDHVEENGAFGVKWPWTRDTNLDGSPLVLGGVHYDHGIVVHSQAVLRWHLGATYTRLRAQAGIADIVADVGDCAASILADGKVLWHRDSVRGGDRPIPLDFDLTGVQDLELHVDYGARYDIGDHFVLADSYLVKTKAP